MTPPVIALRYTHTIPLAILVGITTIALGTALAMFYVLSRCSNIDCNELYIMGSGILTSIALSAIFLVFYDGSVAIDIYHLTFMVVSSLIVSIPMFFMILIVYALIQRKS